MDTIRTFVTGKGETASFYSLPALAEQGYEGISRMPVSLRIVLESLLRHCDGLKVTEQDVKNLATWDAKQVGDYEIPFTVGRIILQDLTGVPLLVDLASMRSAVQDLGADPKKMEPLVPVNLVVDHSVQVDWSSFPASYKQNIQREFERNTERYEFLKWGQQAFETFSVIPPSTGIVHQVNLEYLATAVMQQEGVYYPDSLVGTDSHTTMINGLGIVAWGVGGIEAEAGMLGQPVTFLVPEVVGVNLTGKLRAGVTATDAALYVTELLRKQGVVGKFVEFFGEGAASLSLPDRATIANMAPEYGATMGFFPLDELSLEYLRSTGRSPELVDTVKAYYEAQQLFGMPQQGDIDYSLVLELDLSSIVPSIAGPKRPQDRIALADLKSSFAELTENIYKLPLNRPAVKVSMQGRAGEPEAEITQDVELRDGSILIASITSCTNTSNESLMLAAGILAKKAAALGMKVPAYVKTSMAPGSRLAEKYFNNNDLMEGLDALGFSIVGYGCATCIGNSGPLNPQLEAAVKENELLSCSVLSGNRNFEARIHASVKANFLMSPPLVVAFALAGRVDIDIDNEPLGQAADGSPVYLRDIWPQPEELAQAVAKACSPEDYQQSYASHIAEWDAVEGQQGDCFAWNPESSYIHRPPYFETFSGTGEKSDIEDIIDARPLGIFGDSVTTDHISPAGAIKPSSPAGCFLAELGVERRDFNTYGSRRGNDLIMTRGTFANVRIKNRMVGQAEGGYTLYFGDATVSQPDTDIEAAAGSPTFIYDAGMAYKAAGTPSIVIAGSDYGMGSSRDWAAKGTQLLGVKAVITKSFERIHRSNLVGMGVLPLNFANPADYDRVKDLTDATFSIRGLSNDMPARAEVSLEVKPAGQESFSLPLIVRIDTPIEKEYFRAGGILPYVLNQYC